MRDRFNTFYTNPNSKIFTQFNEELLDSLLKDVKGPALDLGCGRGELTVQLVKRGYEVISTDISSVALDITRENLGALKANLIETDSVPDGKYGIIFAKLLIYAIQNRQKFYKDVHNHLVKDGVFIIMTPVYKKNQDIYVDKVELERDLMAEFGNFEIVEELPGNCLIYKVQARTL